jgi:predicted anti-sigma-YlaC factor YlaD
MTNMTGPACREIRQLLGVYVVGVIDSVERAYVDGHLAECGACREELGGLAGLPALLGRVSLADAERLSDGGYGLPDMEEPPAEILNALLSRVAARRRGRRMRSVLALAAAVAIAAGGTAAVFGMQQDQGVSSAQDVVRGASMVDGAHVTSQISYSATPWDGSAMRVEVKGIMPGTLCKFWVLNAKSGHWSVAATWTVGPGYGEHWYSVSSSVAAAYVHGFRITSLGKTLLSIPAS